MVFRGTTSSGLCPSRPTPINHASSMLGLAGLHLNKGGLYRKTAVTCPGAYLPTMLPTCQPVGDITRTHCINFRRYAGDLQ